jgi:hypothetical protein
VSFPTARPRHFGDVLRYRHSQTLLTNVVMPQLTYNDEDAELWQDDPQEYVRKNFFAAHARCFSAGLLLVTLSFQVRKCYDMMEDYYSPRSAASDVLSTLCKVRWPMLRRRALVLAFNLFIWHIFLRL